MGFRFGHRFNPICHNCITRLSSQFHSRFHPPLSTQLLNFQHLDSSCLILSDNPFYKIIKRWHLGHSHHDHGHQNHQNGISGQEGEKIFRLGLVADIGLATGKALTGYLSGSTAIIADAAHSISDVVLSGVALVSFRLAQAPRDKEHPYGHGKFETLGALGISCMLLATSGGIAWHALEILMGFSVGPEMVSHGVTSVHEHDHHSGGHHHGIDMEHPVLALSMTIMSISIKEGLYWMTKRAGEKQGSGLMKANAWHHRVDAISSVVALIGVGGSILGVKFFDPLAGLVVSAMILKAGAETGYQSILELVDAAIPADHLDPIRKTILQVRGVKGCHRLRGRRAGSCLYLDVNIEVDPFSSVSAAHDIGEAVRQQIHKLHPEVSEIFIHIDPAYSNIINPSITEEQDSLKDSINQHSDASGKENDIEATLANIISSNFAEKMLIQRITRHLFNGNIVLEIEVSMPPDILIRDAMRMAEEAERRILEAVTNVIHVNIQLCLGHPIPKFHH